MGDKGRVNKKTERYHEAGGKSVFFREALPPAFSYFYFMSKVLEESRETSFKKFLWRGPGRSPEKVLAEPGAEPRKSLPEGPTGYAPARRSSS